MPEIKVLPKEISELIAAGEVVERPASVIKELVENSIDAGADNITVEIQHGGITYMRITDNGCGIEKNDVPTAFLRHATSKIKNSGDLNAIGTLGFRGEALAAVSSVARVEMFTKPRDAAFGTHYEIEGGVEKLCEEAGCPDGTTIVIRDIFFNTPARMKFLKKDVSEANAAAAVVERIALSRPEIAFKLIRDGKQALMTPGDGKINTAVYSVLGREFAGTLMEVDGGLDGIGVKGLTCKPVSCRPTRNYQFVFLNGRLVRSGTVTAAVEQAYKNSAMVGKFPGFVLYLTVPLNTVDVNVHPAKTEVRFSDERRIFDAVYSSVKNALARGDTRPEVKLHEPVFNPFERMTTAEYKQQPIMKPTVAEEIYKNRPSLHNAYKPQEKTVLRDANYNVSKTNNTVYIPERIINPPSMAEEASQPQRTVSVDIMRDVEDERPPITLIGEAFLTYIIVQMGESVFMIDKHAAHERILFNRLKKEQKTETQTLLTAVIVALTGDEYNAAISNTEALEKAGFEVEDFGNSSVRVSAVPASLTREDIPSVISELAGKLSKGKAPDSERLDDMYHTVACKAAIKAGSRTSPLEMQKLAERVLYSDDVMYCPHGRPVAFEIKRRELEKQFGRIQ
mgnify:FL=1